MAALPDKGDDVTEDPVNEKTQHSDPDCLTINNDVEISTTEMKNTDHGTSSHVEESTSDISDINNPDGLENENSHAEDVVTQSKADNVVNGNGVFECDMCGRKIKRRDNFRRHYIQAHNLQYNDSNISGNVKNICIFPGCSKGFYHKSRMVSHLEKEHEVVVDIENKSLKSYAEFLEWKAVEESENFVCFTKRDESKISSCTIYSSYVCQHDGSVKRPPGKHDIKRKRLSVRKDLICPARMLVRRNIKNGAIAVRYIKSHNHKIEYEDAKHHPVPTHVREEIKTKLLQNKSVDDIYSELHQEAHEARNSDEKSVALRKVLIEKSKIQYLQKKLKLPANRNCKLMIEDRLKALTTADYNPVLLYKPDGPLEDTGVLYEGQNDESIFIFAIQTKEQCKMFQQFAETIVCLELTQPTVSVPYFILSVRVVDGSYQGYNIAHLITTVKDDEIVRLFFNEIKIRCENKDIEIKTVMTSLDDYGVSAFASVFGQHIQFIYSKWHLHEMFYTKLLTDYPLEEDLRHQVYFTLVALVEETERGQFNSILADFIVLYKDRCPVFVSFLQDNYMNHPQKWALCYQDSKIRNCHNAMHGRILSAQLKSVMKCVKGVCSINELLHGILNIDQSSYLQQECRQMFLQPPQSLHDVGLAIPDTDVNKASESQWTVVESQKTFTVSWNVHGCSEMFCQMRCLKLVCFGLCKHMYTCSCHLQSAICSHIHKVHSLETGVCLLQSSLDKRNHLVISDQSHDFMLHPHVTSTNFNDNVQTLQRAIHDEIDEIRRFVDSELIPEKVLSGINSELKDIVQKFKISVTTKRKNSAPEGCQKKPRSEQL